MIWNFNESQKRYESECKNFRIENAGRKGGNHYRILTIDRSTGIFCKQLGQGSIKEMMEKDI